MAPHRSSQFEVEGPDLVPAESVIGCGLILETGAGIGLLVKVVLF